MITIRSPQCFTVNKTVRHLTQWELFQLHPNDDLDALGFSARRSWEVFGGLIRLPLEGAGVLCALWGTFGFHDEDPDEFYARAIPVLDSCAARFPAYLIEGEAVPFVGRFTACA